MDNEIKININNPKVLEKLYRDDKTSFVNAFNAVYQDVKEQPAAQIWNERINFTQEDVAWGNKNEIIFIAVAAIISGLIAKMPGFLGIEYDTYLAINIGFVVFPMLSMYFAWKQGVAINKYILPALIFIVSAVFINSLPYNEQSSTFILTTIHLPIFLWTVLGYAFVGGDLKDNQKSISFLKFNGNFIVMTALIFFSGVLFTGITIGLFELLGVDIKTTDPMGQWPLEKFDELIAANKRDFDARFAKARVLLASDDWTGAMDELLEIIMRDKKWNDEAPRKTMVGLLELLTPVAPKGGADQTSKSAGGIELMGKSAVQEDPQAAMVSSYRRKLSMMLN